MNKTAHDAALKLFISSFCLFITFLLCTETKDSTKRIFMAMVCLPHRVQSASQTVSTYRIVCAENMSISNTDTRMSADNQYGTYKMRLRWWWVFVPKDLLPLASLGYYYFNFIVQTK